MRERKAIFLSTRPNRIKAKVELDIPKDSVIKPSITLCPGVSPNASAGNTSAKKVQKGPRRLCLPYLRQLQSDGNREHPPEFSPVANIAPDKTRQDKKENRDYEKN
ncbi:hypothetical protein MNV_1750003 [Candidatus Methanoperedens nitroreducens]|uniref:Uncharacterized protein n=1 Tax=Candidatus Methanoperedens nitratireducens TaxID=1392998 RepID=A0A284VMA5_9EURY|nr:hypothetical protein MNV_1750003 [Candidatus Methanoperedens nitroreducens]